MAWRCGRPGSRAFHQPIGATSTPGARVVGHARGASNEPRSLNTRTWPPSSMPRARGVLGDASRPTGAGCAECWRRWLAKVELRKRWVFGVISASGKRSASARVGHLGGRLVVARAARDAARLSVPKPPSACGTGPWPRSIFAQPRSRSAVLVDSLREQRRRRSSSSLSREARDRRARAARPAGGTSRCSASPRRAARSPARSRSGSGGPTRRRTSRCSSWVVAGSTTSACARGVGHELLEHDGEEVVAAQPLEHPLLVGRDRRRVGVPADERLHRRVERRVGERLAELRHVDRPHRTGPQVLALERCRADRAGRRGRDVGAAAAAVAARRR